MTGHNPAAKAAEILADAWWPSHRAMYDLGYGTGYREGWLAGRNEESDAWQKIMGVYREAVTQPTHAELVKRREATP